MDVLLEWQLDEPRLSYVAKLASGRFVARE
jgi:hypothetical protein